MKNYFKTPATIFGLISLIICLYICSINDYMEFKNRNCVVLDKLELSGGYKTTGHFYLILKEERGIIFDIIVSPVTYYQSKIGENLVFNLRQFDIKQTKRENIIYFFGVVISGGLAFALLISGWFISRFDCN